MTRKDIRTAFDRLLGHPPNESVLSELRSSIRRLRTPVHLPRPGRDLFELITGRSVTETVLREVRAAAASRSTRLR